MNDTTPPAINHYYPPTQQIQCQNAIVKILKEAEAGKCIHFLLILQIQTPSPQKWIVSELEKDDIKVSPPTQSSNFHFPHTRVAAAAIKTSSQ